MRRKKILMLMLLYVPLLHLWAGSGTLEVRTVGWTPVSEDNRTMAFGTQPVPGKSEVPFHALSIRVYGVTSPDYHIEISWSADGHTFSDYAELAWEEHGPVNPAFRVAGLHLLPAEAQYVRYRVNNLPVTLTTEWYWFDPPSDFDGSRATVPVMETSRTCDLPGYVTRTGWNCPSGQDYSSGTPSFTDVTHLVVHHSAGSNTSSNWPAVVLSIWNYHRFTNGWSDIGYNFLIDPDGVIYEGRGGNEGYTLDVLPAATCGSNTGTMAVCVLGDFTSIEPAVLAISSLEELLAWKASSGTIDPLGASSLNSYGVLDHIFGHRQGCTTACPGDLLFAELPVIRSDVSDLMSAGCATGTPRLTYASHTADDNNDGDSSGDDDGQVESGETIEVYVTLLNNGTATATNVTLTATTGAPGVSFIDATLDFGTIDAGVSVESGDLDIVFAPDVPTGPVEFYLALESAEGSWGDTMVIEVVNSCLPVADFSADTISGSAPLTVQMIDQSIGALGYSWTFPGGSPVAASNAEPEVLYGQPGSYDVVLTVYNECGMHTIVKSNFIEVTAISATREHTMPEKVFPHPAEDVLHVRFSDAGLRNLQLTDVSGRLCVQQSSGSDMVDIPVKHLAPGLYFLTIRGDASDAPSGMPIVIR